MCGITGIISKNKISKGIIELMTDTIIHRGPDGFGYYYGDNFVFGHRRLSIIDLTESGRQPMEYQDRYIITYNGEIYNYFEIKKELISYGYQFKTNTDTEVIIASYDYWGKECLNKFNGMWAFVIYDKLEMKYFISRDRFGKKPFYYYKTSDLFIFGSEIKAILKHPSVKVKENIVYLKSYLKYGPKEYIKETAFENIFRFDFSSYFEGTIEELLNEFTQYKFWELKPNLCYERFDEEKAKKYAKQYYELLKDAVKIRLRADVKVGSALSGGLDSSSIVYLINNILKEQGNEELQETFSTVYKSEGTKDCDESIFIDSLAKQLCVKSNQIEPHINDVIIEHEKVIYMMENPPESTCMSGWHTFKLVKNSSVKVTLAGQGADEQLAGYPIYYTLYIISLNFFDLVKELKYLLTIEYYKKFIFIGILLNLTRTIFGYKFLDFIINKLLKKNKKFNLNHELSTNMSHGLVNLLHYSDHTSMAHSIESRMPFLDYRLVEFLASIPSSYKMHNGWTKYIARLAFDKKLPSNIVWRKDKMGWPIPENYWFKGKLKKDFVNRIETCKELEEYVTNLDIRNQLNSNIEIKYLIRYFNISVWFKIFNKGL